ncbi:Stress response protein nst1 [Fusarium oxysporum f. sp. albedinis]|nr:Stress response protein nst1 [Fusarium oxysporum f. sp. albedinis]
MTFEVEIDAVFSFLTVLAHRRPLENALQSHTSPMSIYWMLGVPWSLKHKQEMEDGMSYLEGGQDGSKKEAKHYQI